MIIHTDEPLAIGQRVTTGSVRNPQGRDVPARFVVLRPATVEELLAQARELHAICVPDPCPYIYDVATD